MILGISLQELIYPTTPNPVINFEFCQAEVQLRTSALLEEL